MPPQGGAKSSYWSPFPFFSTLPFYSDIEYSSLVPHGAIYRDAPDSVSPGVISLVSSHPQIVGEGKL